jgi:D-alanyl-D-alanine carboxypeptidase
MKNLLLFFTSFFLLTTNLYAQNNGCSSDYSALVIDERNGEILSQTRSDKVSYPASLVKLMTLYLTFEAIENKKLTPESELTVSERGEEVGAVNKVNSLHLKQGDKITVREAIHSVIVKSFNEAAVTLAEAVAGDEWSFTRKMNQKAAKLGMTNTSFHNASGLHAEGQYTTSYDLARLALALKKDFPGYYSLFGLKEFKYRGTEYETHNHVLVEYKGAEGMKTGFTNASGFNLVSSAKKNDARVISILLGCSTSKQRDEQTKELLDDAFEKITEDKKSKVCVRLQKVFDYKVTDKDSEPQAEEEDEKEGE